MPFSMRAHAGPATLCLSVLACSCADSAGSASDQADAVTAGSVYVISQDVAEAIFFDTIEDGRLVVHLRSRGLDFNVTEARTQEAAHVLTMPPGTILVAPPATRAGTFRIVPSDETEMRTDEETGTTYVPADQFARDFGSVDGRRVLERGNNIAGFAVKLVRSYFHDMATLRVNEGGGFIAEPVPLGDVLADASLESASADATAIEPQDVTPGAAPHFVRLAKVDHDFSGKELVRKGETVLRVKSGRIAIEPQAAYSFRMKSRKLEDLAFQIRGDLDASLELELAAEASTSSEVQATLFERYHTLPVQMVGAIPVVETIRFRIDASCQFTADGSETVSAGATLHESIAAGARFADGTWTNTSEFGAPTFGAIPPTFRVQGGTKLSCSFTPKFDLFLYNLIGPGLWASASTTLAADAATGNGAPSELSWSLDGELTAMLGLDVNGKLPGFPRLQSLLDSGLAKAQLTLFDKKIRLGSGKIALSP